MKKVDLKEVGRKAKEKGKEFYGEHKLYVGYCLGVITFGVVRDVIDRIFERKQASIRFDPGEENGTLIGTVSMINRFGKKCDHFTLKYDLSNAEDSKIFTEMNNNIMEVLYPGD